MTHSVSPLKNLKPENLKSAALHAARTADADRESAITNSATLDDEPPNQRAPDGALIEPLSEPEQPPPPASPMGRPPANGHDPLDASPFAQVLSIYPADRVGNEPKAYFAFEHALEVLGDTDDVIDAIITLKLERGADAPDLADALAIIIERCNTGRQ